MSKQDKHAVVNSDGIPCRCACGYDAFEELETENSLPDEDMVREELADHLALYGARDEAEAVRGRPNVGLIELPYVRTNEGETVFLPPPGARGMALLLRKAPGGTMQSAQVWPYAVPVDDQMPCTDEYDSDGRPIFREWRDA